jgi:hypothetical protein
VECVGRVSPWDGEVRFMRFTKAEIRDYFDREDRLYRLAMLCTHWIRDTAPFTPSAMSEAKSLSMTIAGRTITFSDLAVELVDYNRREMISSDFLLNHLHSLVRVPFELLKDYCEDFDTATRQSVLMTKLRNMPWYEYARLVRNAVSHNFRFAFSARDKSELPATWSDIVIDSNHDGQAITYDTLWHRTGYALFLEMREFAGLLPELGTSV